MAEPPGAARRDGDGSVTPERWQRISDIVADALAIGDLRARAEFVRDAVADDTAMLKEIDALLVHAETPAPTLTPEALAHGIRMTLGEAALATAVADQESATQARWIGRRVGAWRITEAIASGGMGSVWKAVRADDAYRQTVAIKVVRAALADEALVRRFLAERQLLATLEHPNIARLLDGGQLDDGTPYLVLEYIEGQPIDAWCDAHELGIDRRLDLFVAVCGAVHYAHQRLIVHRDLKPGNILVDAEGRVKLLDFGIARLLDADALDPGGRVPAAAPTEANAMTPAYASPEQIKGQPITTASDVYALGVLLYRLLTGHSPYRSKPGEPLTLAREIAETEPTRPSTALARSATHTAQRSRARALRGDLDNIVLKAMQKAPERRYASVEQLADDVRRYRDHLPVRARPDSWRYRSWKFVVRNRWAVVAAALAVVGVTTALIIAVVQEREARLAQARAERHLAEVRALANDFIFKLLPPLQRIGGTRAVQRDMLDTSARYLAAIANERDVAPEIALEAARAFTALAQLGARDLVAARVQADWLRDALKLIAAARARGADERLAVRRELTARTALASVAVNAGDASEALRQRAAAVALARAHAEPADDIALQLARADALIEAARLPVLSIAANERWPLAAEALAIQRALAARPIPATDAADVDERHAVVALYAAIVASESAPPTLPAGTARSLADESVALFAARNASHANEPHTLGNLAFATSMAAQLAREAGDMSAARQGFADARRHAAALARIEPDFPQARLNAVAAAIAELEMELHAQAEPRVLLRMVDALRDDMAQLPASLRDERPGRVVQFALALGSAETNWRLCQANEAPPAAECERRLRDALTSFREANRMLPSVADAIEPGSEATLELLRTGEARTEAALARNAARRR